MRLVCPRCGAEYEIDDRLIPASGREVECSSCENVWFQAGRLRMPAPVAAAAAPTGEAGAPRLGRPLPEDVMGILRDEAAHFRASHPGIEAALPPDMAPADPDAVATAEDTGAAVAGGAPAVHTGVPAGMPAAPEASPEAGGGDAPGVPATAIALPAGTGDAVAAGGAPVGGDHEKAAPDRLCAGLDTPEAPPEAGAKPDGDGKRASLPPTTPIPAGPDLHAAAGAPDPRPGPRTARPDAGAGASATPARRGGFGKGFVIGLLIAAVFFGLYAAAPHAGEGVLGDALRAIRAAGDGFHHWVQAQVYWVQAQFSRLR